MKKLILSILWLIASYISSSQNDKTSLKPDSILVDSNGYPTHFAFRLDDQVPLLAKHILQSEYSVVLEKQYVQEQILSDSMININQQTILTLNRQLIDRSYKINELNYQVNTQAIRIKKLRIKVVLYPMIVAVVTLIASSIIK